MNLDSKFENCTDLELLAKIPNKSVHMVLTDPPYIISKDSGMDRYNKNKELAKTDVKYGTKYAIATNYGDWDKNYTIENLDRVIQEFRRILIPGGSCIIFFDIWKIETLANLLEKHKFSKIRLVEWIKTNPVPINSKSTYLSNAREIAISCVNGSKKSVFNSEYDNGVYSYPIYSGKDRFHPTQKSLPLFVDLVKKHTNSGDVVVDPYGGSGTTAIAAKRLGRKYISCEIDSIFYEKSLKRINDDDMEIVGLG